MNQKKVLGRGLGALIPQREAPAPSGLAEIPLSQISPNPYQPRKSFNEASIDELARSVREHGIVQPLVVTRAGDRYTLYDGWITNCKLPKPWWRLRGASMSPP